MTTRATSRKTPKPLTYRVFLGEFSQQWVGVRKVNGNIVHSVQRPTQAQADAAIRQQPNAPRFV